MQFYITYEVIRNLENKDGAGRNPHHQKFILLYNVITYFLLLLQL